MMVGACKCILLIVANKVFIEELLSNVNDISEISRIAIGDAL